MSLPLALLCLLLARADDPPEGRWVWGDLHAHSGWSYDGCEDEGALCAPRGALPGEDFFEEAAASTLDFAALTDHAEAGSWGPEGADGPLWDVWDEQAAVVQRAEGGPVLPLLGYEWTAFREDEHRGHARGTHRTVILAEDDACVPRRISGFLFDGGAQTAPDGLSVYLQSEAEPVDTVSDLWEALDAAEAACGPTRWLTFAHHSAYTNPQQTDWGLDENRPTRETLIEIASEHGSSECVDPDAEGCDWRRNDAQGYAPEGSVQAALDAGFALGFVGGTDSHDARPGSLADGPGAVGHLVNSLPRQQLAPGALTGVLLLDGEALDANTLLDALALRRTLASSGPRPDLRAWAQSEDGSVWLPGELLPRDAMPVTIYLELGDPGEGYTLSQVERLGPGGQVEETSAASEATMTWSGRPGDWTYLRLRYDAPASADGEERVWLSPWFVERRCGCALVPAASLGPLASILLAAALLARRRQPRDRSF